MRYLAVAAALALVAGCGGKTDEVDGAGGTGAGGHGVGGSGVGGSGGHGVGGSGVGGSGVGGSGVGGSGVGGSGVGGSGGAAIAELIGKVCDQAATLPCAPAGCKSELYQSWGKAYESGCENLFVDALTCIADHPLTCGGDQVVVPPECGPAVEALENCSSVPSVCSSGAGPGFCSIDCEVWGATCTEHMGSLTCTCTHGPNAGTSFGLSGSCDPATLDMLGGFCS